MISPYTTFDNSSLVALSYNCKRLHKLKLERAS